MQETHCTEESETVGLIVSTGGCEERSQELVVVGGRMGDGEATDGVEVVWNKSQRQAKEKCDVSTRSTPAPCFSSQLQYSRRLKFFGYVWCDDELW